MIEFKFCGLADIGHFDALIAVVSDQDDVSSKVVRKLFGQDLSSKELTPFEAKHGQTRKLSLVRENQRILDLVLVGTGPKDELNGHKAENLGGKIYKMASALKNKEVGIIFNDFAYAENLLFGIKLASYDFKKYKTKKLLKEEDSSQHELSVIASICDDPKLLSEKYSSFDKMGQSIFWARDLVNEAPNVLTPTHYADVAKEALEKLGVEVEVLDEEQMNALGMHALLGVGKGSIYPPRLLIAKYNNAPEQAAPVALVGKGVTFDTGGISLKPSGDMHLMKGDMGGSAAVLGSMMALASTKAKVNVIGAVAIVENMIGHNAQRPGDIVYTMSGQTVEVLNTDAEGRLILADALWYVQQNYKPRAIVDIATLTGAIVVALGHTFAGCFSNNDALSAKIAEASKSANEPVWNLPLHEEYTKLIKSDIADWANIGVARGAAGSSTAAQFLEKFIEKDMPWAHLDIAGVSWSNTGSDICPKGATGYGVRLLTRIAQSYHE